MIKKWNDPEALLESQRYDNPIPSRTLISSHIEQSEQGLSYDDLAEKFALKSDDNLEALRRRLGAMVRDGQLLRIGQTYQLCNDDQEFDATVEINHRGQGFAVIKDHNDLVLTERELRLVFHGDRIRVRPTSIDRRGKQQGFITEVIKHQVQQLIGELSEHEGEFFIQPKDYLTLWGDMDFQRVEFFVNYVKSIPQGAKARDDSKLVRDNLQESVSCDKALYTINPKVDSKKQRRVQCSLKLDELIASGVEYEKKDISLILESKKRTFNK